MLSNLKLLLHLLALAETYFNVNMCTCGYTLWCVFLCVRYPFVGKFMPISTWKHPLDRYTRKVLETCRAKGFQDLNLEGARLLLQAKEEYVASVATTRYPLVDRGKPR